MPNTIKTISVKCFGDIIEEYIANAALSPGHLIEVMSTGKVRKHSTAGGNALKIFAIEDDLQGKGVDDDYAAADIVQARYAQPGDVINAILRDGETAVIGSWLESNGDGCLKVFTQVPESQEIVGHESSLELTVDMDRPLCIVGQAVEALDLSGSSGTESSGLVDDRRIKVRIA